MYKIGDFVVYGIEGVCIINDIVTKSFGSLDNAQYYVLVPATNKGSTFYVPVDNQLLTSKMMKLLDYDDILDLISNTKALEWENNNKLRAKQYKEVFSSYNREGLFSLAKLLHLAKSGKIPSVKKLYAMDDEIIRRISQLLYLEFAYSVDIEIDQVLPFVAGEIQCSRKEMN